MTTTINHGSRHFNFSSTLPVSADFIEVHDLQPVVWCSCPPDSTFNDSTVFSSKLSRTFAYGESNKEASEADAGSGSASSSPSPSEKAELSQRPRRPQSTVRSRGGRERRNDTKHPLYKGVRKRHGDRWVSEIREPGKKSRIWLGTFPTPEMAARAYDVAVFNLKRPYAYVNFPEAVSSLPILQSRSPKNIQEAATAAAAAFGGGASSSYAGRSGGVVPTSQAPETSNLSFTSSPMPQQKQLQLHPQSSIPEQQQHLLHPQSTSPLRTEPSFFDEDLIFNMPKSPLRTEPPFFDEDLIFNMPDVLTDMAEGLMITPPLLHHGTEDGDNINGDKSGADSPLWVL